MAVRELVIYPDEVLKKKCAPVEVFDEELKTLIDDMAETMYAAPGVGLAANQVGVSKRVCVIDIGEDEGESALHIFVNPEFVESSGQINWEEGCLSFPEILVDVERFEKIVVKAQDASGNFFEMEAHGLMAVALQHEVDHLNGVSLANKVGYLRRKMMIKELLKLKQARQEQ